MIYGVGLLLAVIVCGLWNVIVRFDAGQIEVTDDSYHKSLDN